MERVFISSLARGEMGEIRKAARQAVEALEMFPVMFETTGASERPPRAELLDKVAGSDVVLLILGAEYGEAGESGFSPTEDEFNAARQSGRPILTIAQEVDREPKQDDFVGRVRGTWECGTFSPGFTGAADVGFATTRALNGWRNRKPAGEQRAAAEARALELARGSESPHVSYGGSKLRVVAVPLLSRPLLDAVALDDSDLPDRMATLARTAGLVSNDMAMDEAGIDREGTVRLTFKSQRGWEQLNLAVGADGGVVAEGAVGGQVEHFGSSVVADWRVNSVIEQALGYALSVWQRIDRDDSVDQVLLAVAVPEAPQKVYAMSEPGNRLSMGGLMGGGIPHVLVAPEPPLLARRADLRRAETVAQLRAELKRHFAAANMLHAG